MDHHVGYDPPPASDDGHSRINTVTFHLWCLSHMYVLRDEMGPEEANNHQIGRATTACGLAVVHPLRCIKAQHEFFRYSPDSQCLAGSSRSLYSSYGPYLASISLLFFSLSECSPRLTLLLYSSLLRRPPSVLKLLLLQLSVSKGFLQSLMFSALPSSNPVEM